MSKRIEKDGKFYRMRRGELVEIPKEWVGKVTTPATIRKRPSKMTRKLRRATKLDKSVKGLEYVERKQRVEE